MRRPRRVEERGAAMLELAVMSPLLLLMLVGVLDFSRMMYVGITLASAARAGAQYGAQSVTSASDTAGMRQAALNDAGDVSGVTVVAQEQIYCPSAGGGNVTAPSATATCADGSQPLVYVTVQAQKNFSIFLTLPGLSSSYPVTQVATMRAQ